MIGPISASIDFKPVVQDDLKTRRDFLSLAGDTRNLMAQTKEIEISDSVLNSVTIDKPELERAIKNQIGDSAKEVTNTEVTVLNDFYGDRFGKYHNNLSTNVLIGDSSMWFTLNIKGKSTTIADPLNDIFSVEIETYIQNVMDALDANGNGQITWTEYRDYKPL